MDLYGKNQGYEIDHPPTKWGERVLQESMRRLDISDREVYPERHGVSDCVYYMRTGICGFGSHCRFNHPHDRNAVVMDAGIVGWDYPQRPEELPCQYYLKTGNCKFGASCKFHHPLNAGGSLTNAPLNFHGLPLRPGEKECSYYLKTGQCKFGRLCKFHHPQPTGLSMPEAAPPFYPTVQTSSDLPPLPEQAPGPSPGYRVARPPLVPGSYVPGPVHLSPMVVPMPGGWGSYSGPVSPVLSPGAQPPGVSSYGVSTLSPSTLAYYFPERPGEPECQYYLKTGSCKFGASCKYHHPPDRAVSAAASAACVLGPLGLPLRPETQPCNFYMQHGICKYGTTCKFDHPVSMMKYSASASSVTETPVAPYMAGSTLTAIPPVSVPWSGQSPVLLSSSSSMVGGPQEVSHSS